MTFNRDRAIARAHARGTSPAIIGKLYRISASRVCQIVRQQAEWRAGT